MLPWSLQGLPRISRCLFRPSFFAAKDGCFFELDDADRFWDFLPETARKKYIVVATQAD